MLIFVSISNQFGGSFSWEHVDQSGCDIVEATHNKCLKSIKESSLWDVLPISNWIYWSLQHVGSNSVGNKVLESHENHLLPVILVQFHIGAHNVDSAE